MPSSLISILQVVIGALIANYLWARYDSPSIGILTDTASIRSNAMWGGERFEIGVHNRGRKQADNCKAEIWLYGYSSEEEIYIRYLHPVGWLDEQENTKLIPEELDTVTDLAPGESKLLYIGHALGVDYEYYFPQLFDDNRYKLYILPEEVKESIPGLLQKENLMPEEVTEDVSIHRHHEITKAIPFRLLVNTDWHEAELSIETANSGSKVYDIDFTQEEIGGVPTTHFTPRKKREYIMNRLRALVDGVFD